MHGGQDNRAVVAKCPGGTWRDHLHFKLNLSGDAHKVVRTEVKLRPINASCSYNKYGSKWCVHREQTSTKGWQIKAQSFNIIN